MSHLIDVMFEERTLQLRPDQLSVNNLAVAFRLIPETIILVSSCGTVAISEDGLFGDVDPLYSWTVEGDKATNRLMGRNGTGPQQQQQQQQSKPLGDRWKPHTFSPVIRSSRQVCAQTITLACLKDLY